ncbi:MAG TPA: DUF4142 domain-containing protein [Usitatibacter sp.]|nr:DUF4142 domain-containing protein [Usitatibacter sp.]
MKSNTQRAAITVGLVSLTLAFGAAAQSTAGSGAAGSTNSGSQAKGAAQSGASAQKADNKAAGGNLDRSDRNFVTKAAQHGKAEVDLGKMAQDKASNPQVKEFARRMVEDHGKANQELMTIASAKGIQVPTETDKDHQKLANKLQKLQGAEFDREYMQHMVKDHKKDVSEFQKASKNAKDAEVKAFAAKNLPTLQEHLKMAQSTESAVKTASRGGADKGAARTAANSGGAPGSGTSAATGGTGGAGTGVGASGSGGASGSSANTSKANTTKQ